MIKVFVLFVLLFASTAVNAQRSWYEYKAADFSLSFPGEPENFTEPSETELGEVMVYYLSYEADNGAVFMAAYNEYPPAELSIDHSYDVLYGAMDGVSDLMDIKEESIRELKFKNYIGLAFNGVFTDGGYKVVYRLFLVENTMYQLMVICEPTERIPLDLAKQYFDSFTAK